MFTENYLQNKSGVPRREVLFVEWKGPHCSKGWGEVWGCTWGLLSYPQGFHEPCKFPSFLPGDSESLNLGWAQRHF